MGPEVKHARVSHCPVPGPRPAHASPRPAAAAHGAAACGFLGLPLRLRQNIYRRVLAVGHPVYLFQDAGPRVEAFAPDRPRRWLALLYTNHQIHSEARAVLYGTNSFCLVDRPQRQQDGVVLRSFLNCIGASNAELLSCLCISFPVVERAQQGGNQVGEATIREDSLQNLALLRSSCASLATLEMQISQENSRFLAGADVGDDDAQLVRAALLRIGAQLRAIPSVEKVIARLYVRDLAPWVIDVMQRLGWVVLDG